MFIVGIIISIKSPELLERRLNAKEEESEQKLVILIRGIIFLFTFVLAGLNFRFGGSNLPEAVIIIASIIFLISYIMYAEVLRENVYLSRTVEVSENQKWSTADYTGLSDIPCIPPQSFYFYQCR